jgi:hypothetical protein
MSKFRDESEFAEYFTKEHNWQSEPKEGKCCKNCNHHTFKIYDEEWEYVNDMPLQHPVKCLEAGRQLKEAIMDKRAGMFADSSGYCDIYKRESAWKKFFDGIQRITYAVRCKISGMGLKA